MFSMMGQRFGEGLEVRKDLPCSMSEQYTYIVFRIQTLLNSNTFRKFDVRFIDQQKCFQVRSPTT